MPVAAQYADFLGGGGDLGPSNVQAPHDPNDDPNPNNPGGLSNNQIARNQAGHSNPEFSRQLQKLPPATGSPVAPGTPGYDQFGNPYSTQPAGTPTGVTRRDSNGNLVQVVADTPAQRDAYNSQLGTVNDQGYMNGAQQLGFTPPSGDNSAAGGPATALTANGTGAGSSRLAQNNAQGWIDFSKMTGVGGPAQRTDAASTDVKQFLDEERARKGPSEAEALLSKASDRIRSQALGIAAGARGGAAARFQAGREALASNAATGAQATQDIGTLRAQEDAANRNRQMGLLGLLGQLGQSGDSTAAQYAGYGSNQQTNGVNAAVSAENNYDAGMRQASGQSQQQQQFEQQFNNLTAAQKAQIAEQRRQEPTFLENAFNYGAKYAPLLAGL